MQIASDVQKQALKGLLETYPKDEEAKIAKVVAIFDALHIKSIANEQKERYHQKAIEHLKAVGVQEERKRHLLQLANELLWRVK